MNLSWTKIPKVVVISLVICSACVVDEAHTDERAQYAVVTANSEATEVGMRVLASGGSAIDAAVAIQMVLGVVEPQSSGLGGGAIALYRSARERKIVAFDGLAKSPASYDPASSTLVNFLHSGAAVGVPGTMRMLEIMHRQYGRLPWSNLFERAIELAYTGFTVSPSLARSLAAASKAGMVTPIWLTDGAYKIAAEGANVRHLELSETLRKIAAEGANAIYANSAKRISEAVQSSTPPGRVSVDDIATYRPVERAPLCLELRQHKICSFPPPSYGG